MNWDAVQWLLPIVVGPSSALAGWFFGHRQRAVVVDGLELENEGKALNLYEQTIRISEAQQQRMLAMTEEIERFRDELLACTEARDTAERRYVSLQQQIQIERAKDQLEISKLRHELASLNVKIVAMSGATEYGTSGGDG